MKTSLVIYGSAADGGGLSMLDKDKEEFIHFKNEPGNSFSLSHNSVSVIHRDKNGTLWIGTNGGGLNKYNPKDKTFIRLQRKRWLAERYDLWNS